MIKLWLALWFWKQWLISDGQQFHKYQQKEHSPLTERKKEAKTTHDVGNPCPDLGQE
jgi:hypothetical protein